MMNNPDRQRGFLLNYSSRDNRNRFEITLYGAGDGGVPLKLIIDTFRPLFFVPRSVPPDQTRAAAQRKPLEMRSMDGTAVDCLYFSTYSAAIDCSRRLRAGNYTVYETDIHPVERFLMERLVCGGFEAQGQSVRESRLTVMRNPQIRGADVTPRLKVLSLDIETNAASGELYSIAATESKGQVFMIGPATDGCQAVMCRDERELLGRFLEHLRAEDPDVIVGWNVVDFDLRVLQERCAACGAPFSMGRDSVARVIQSQATAGYIARVPGRVVLDIPHMLRAFHHTFDDYSLNAVAHEMLGKKKDIELTGAQKIEEINRQFRDDKAALARYNLQDTVLALEIFEAAAVLPNAIERTKRSGHLLDRTGGSVAAFDYLYLPRLHREGYVAPDTVDAVTAVEPLPGGYVLDPKPGLFENVLVFDFKSLYPSLIMTFAIDPLGLVAESSERVKGPVGPSFAVKPSILPTIIAQLMEARAEARRLDNPYLSQAIKILMNSFYGVLGARGCRFFSPEIASTITRTGQFVLKTTIERIESAAGLPVIYGDTDSLFVLLGAGRDTDAQRVGAEISRDTTEWLSTHLRERFGVTSALELKFETHFRHFFVPPVRGGVVGSKKHYCGSTVPDNGELTLHFKGMESARTDWTELAKDFQHELYMRLFTGKPLEQYIIDTTDMVKTGKLDAKLMYRKRLRKDIGDYTANVPYHVQAARLLDHPVHVVKYFITVDGPQPLEKLASPLDYNHYVESQLKPIADSILELRGQSFDSVLSGQMSLFPAGG